MKLIGTNTIEINQATMEAILEEWLRIDHNIAVKVTKIRATTENHCPTFRVDFTAEEKP